MPRGYDDVGWWSHGHPPGAPGPAVLAGHVDSRQGPAVFYRLRELRPGDTVTVESDGRSVSFAVEHVEQYAKHTFPTARVHAGMRLPALRLITCGSEFDRSRGHYQDNIVVYATAS